eukprot:4434394-Prymnesium_polylepis.1
MRAAPSDVSCRAQACLRPARERALSFLLPAASASAFQRRFLHLSLLTGAHLGTTAILAMGISNVLADALSMSVGEYLSNRSYNKYVLKELERETWCRTARRARGWRLHPHREICSTAAVCGPLPTHAVGLSLSALRAHCRVLRATRWVPRRRELENYPEGEINEMIALFESRGMSHADAKE